MASQLNFDRLVQDERVNRTIYTDAEAFEAEMERIFECTWVFAGHESEGWRIVWKKAVLVNNDEVIDNLTFIV